MRPEVKRIGLSEVDCGQRPICSDGFSRMLDGGEAFGGIVQESVRSRTSPTRRGDFRMRGTLLAMLVAAGVGLAGSASVSAAAISGAVIGDAANAASPVETVQHWRWGSGGHWRWGSRGGHWRWGSGGGHWRWGSRGPRRGPWGGAG